MATNAPRCSNKLAELLAAGELSQNNFDALSSLLDQDIQNLSQLTLKVPGPNVNLARTTDLSELESISKVLNLPELLQEILSFLPADNLLFSAQFVCRGFRAAVNAAGLKKELFRAPKPADSERMRLPFELRGIRNARVSPISVVIFPSEISDKAKQSKALCETFVCQPPVNFLKLTSHYRARAPPERLHQYLLHSENGVTYGDVFREVDKMKEDGLIDLFKQISVLRGSDKMIWEYGGWNDGPAREDSVLEQVVAL